MGKTRLAEECAARATLGGTVLIGRATASSAAAAVPLGALAHLLPPDNDLSDPVNAFARVAAAIRSEGRGARPPCWSTICTCWTRSPACCCASCSTPERRG